MVAKRLILEHSSITIKNGNRSQSTPQFVFFKEIIKFKVNNNSKPGWEKLCSFTLKQLSEFWSSVLSLRCTSFAVSQGKSEPSVSFLNELCVIAYYHSLMWFILVFSKDFYWFFKNPFAICIHLIFYATNIARFFQPFFLKTFLKFSPKTTTTKKPFLGPLLPAVAVKKA